MAALVAATCCALWAAHGAELTVKSLLDETFVASDNYFLSPNPPGPTYISTTSGMLDLVARTPTSNFELRGDLHYRHYWGPGAQNRPDAWEPGVKAAFDTTEKLTKYNFAASWYRQEAVIVQLLETGTATVGGYVDTTLIEGGLRHELSPTDTLTWVNHAASVEFTDPTRFPFTDAYTEGGWIHKWNRTTDVTTTVQFERLATDNPEHSQVLFWRLLAGPQTNLSNNLNVKAAFGVALIEIDNPSATLLTTPGSLALATIPGSVTTWLGNLEVTYKLRETDQLSLIAARTVAPTSLGSVQGTESVGLSLRHDLTRLSWVYIFGGVTRIVPLVGTPSDLFSASVAFTYRLTPEWRTQLTYRFDQRKDTTSTAQANTFLVSLARDWTVLP